MNNPLQRIRLALKCQDLHKAIHFRCVEFTYVELCTIAISFIHLMSNFNLLGPLRNSFLHHAFTLGCHLRYSYKRCVRLEELQVMIKALIITFKRRVELILHQSMFRIVRWNTLKEINPQDLFNMKLEFIAYVLGKELPTKFFVQEPIQ